MTAIRQPMEALRLRLVVQVGGRTGALGLSRASTLAPGVRPGSAANEFPLTLTPR